MKNFVKKLEQWDVSRVTPYINNSRTHSDHQIAQIAASIKEFGFTNPILVTPDGNMIAGHGRLMAARQLGLDKVPVVIVEGLTELQRKALVIADNKIALNAAWDNELLKTELQDLELGDFDVDLLGFSKVELLILEGGEEVDDIEQEYKNMPSFNNEQILDKGIIVHFVNDDDLRLFSELVNQKITSKTKSIWYPKQEAVSVANTRYV